MPEDNKTIIRNIQRGNLQEFENVFRSYYQLLCHYANSLVKDSGQSEEIVQDLFCQLWENREKLEIHTSLKSYLYKATYLNSLQYLRRKKTKNQFEEYIKHRNENESMQIGTIEEKEIGNIIQETLANLPDRCSKIFKMSRFEGLKYNEIAEKLSISVKTVEANMGKALKAFRENLKDYVGTIILF